MNTVPPYALLALSRSEVDTLPGVIMLEFGVDWCPHCLGAQALIASALGQHATIRHLRIEDGPGRPLGRSFRVKRWPTLILLRDGIELSRLVRPTATGSVAEWLGTALA